MKCSVCSNDCDPSDIYCSNCSYRLKKENGKTNPDLQNVCSICGNQMEEGYLVSYQRMLWRKDIPGIWNLIVRGEKLNDTSSALFGRSYFLCKRCEHCRQISISY